MDHDNKILCARRADLVFVINFSVDRSLPDYPVPVPADGDWKVVLDTDAAPFGGHDRIDPQVTHTAAHHPERGRSVLVYTPARTALVLAQSDL